MHPDLVNLLELQAKDMALLEADRRLDAVLAETEALDQQLGEAHRAVEQAQKLLVEAQRHRTELEAKLDTYRKLEERGKARLNQVRTPKELQAVNAELDLTRQVLAKEETDWIKLSDLIAGHEVVSSEAERRLAEMRESQKAARGEIDLRRAEAEAERTEVLTARDAAATEVNRALRARYERLRGVKSVSVVVALSGAACGACHTTVPLNRRSQIRAGTLIDSCESCGVILYADDSVE